MTHSPDIYIRQQAYMIDEVMLWNVLHVCELSEMTKMERWNQSIFQVYCKVPSRSTHGTKLIACVFIRQWLRFTGTLSTNSLITNPRISIVALAMAVGQHAPLHDDVIKWKYFPRYWPFARGIHRPPVNSPHKGQWSGALMFLLICVWIPVWANNRKAGDLGRHRAHTDVTVTDRK